MEGGVESKQAKVRAIQDLSNKQTDGGSDSSNTGDDEYTRSLACSPGHKSTASRLETPCLPCSRSANRSTQERGGIRRRLANLSSSMHHWQLPTCKGAWHHYCWVADRPLVTAWL